eukprot:scaffold323_cov232-Pinguiococcus_pyrenoidosus.AAC.11
MGLAQGFTFHSPFLRTHAPKSSSMGNTCGRRTCDCRWCALAAASHRGKARSSSTDRRSSPASRAPVPQSARNA